LNTTWKPTGTYWVNKTAELLKQQEREEARLQWEADVKAAEEEEAEERIELLKT